MPRTWPFGPAGNILDRHVGALGGANGYRRDIQVFQAKHVDAEVVGGSGTLGSHSRQRVTKALADARKAVVSVGWQCQRAIDEWPKERYRIHERQREFRLIGDRGRRRPLALITPLAALMATPLGRVGATVNVSPLPVTCGVSDIALPTSNGQL